MILKSLLLCILTAVVLPAAALADTQIFHCKLAVSRSNNWVPPEIYITHDTTSGEVRVADIIVQHFVGKPVAGEVVVDNPRRITFGWNLTEATVEPTRYLKAMQYRATIQKSNLAVAISATPTGYANHFRGDGGCVLE